MFTRARRVCSIGGCRNSEDRNPELHFYTLPGRKYEVERKQRWIEAIRKTKGSNTSWAPTSYTRVCSAHFKGGKRSDIERDEAYVPSIFPKLRHNDHFHNEATRARVPDPEGSISTILLLGLNKHEFIKVTPMDVEQLTNSRSVSCQTDPTESPEEQQEEPNVLFCWSEGNEASTQTQIFFKLRNQQQLLIERRIQLVNRGCGTDVGMDLGFAGFESILSDRSMLQMAGVSYQIFSVFLNLTEFGKNGQPACYRKLTRESRLLLFLTKIKSGLPFAALGCIFGVHEITASRIFFEILETLADKTKTWISWPPREIVGTNLPATFAEFPTCRCIMHCMEVCTDPPPTAEQREVMYSSTKDRYTVKFLVAITLDGFVCKVSGAYGGRFTDSLICDDCDFLGFIGNGDVIIANKGFSKIKPKLSKRNATLVIPPFERNLELTASGNNKGEKRPSLRSHVARAIRRIKIYGILNHFDLELLDYADAIMHICCVIANMQPPLIKKDKTS